MTAVSIKFTNSNEKPIHVQIDPWAGIYLLQKGEALDIEVEIETNSPTFSIEEHSDTRILMIANSADYYVVRNGERIHWTKFQSNC